MIFDYLTFDDIKNNIYKVCKLFHVQSLKVLDKKYMHYFCCKWMIDSLMTLKPASIPDKIKYFEKEAHLVLHGLLICLLNDVICGIACDAKEFEKEDLMDCVEENTDFIFTGQLQGHTLKQCKKLVVKFQTDMSRFTDWSIKELKDTILEMHEWDYKSFI